MNEIDRCTERLIDRYTFIYYDNVFLLTHIITLLLLLFHPLFSFHAHYYTIGHNVIRNINRAFNSKLIDNISDRFVRDSNKRRLSELLRENNDFINNKYSVCNDIYAILKPVRANTYKYNTHYLPISVVDDTDFRMICELVRRRRRRRRRY